MGMKTSQAKPFDIPKALVWEAYRQVAANKGAPGVDGQTLREFETRLKDNLYKIWNRMSSGTYMPPPVKAVEIPKPHGGGTRVLGVPHGRRQGGPDGGGHVLGRKGRTTVPPRLLWLPAGQVRPRRRRQMPAAVLELRLGH